MKKTLLAIACGLVIALTAATAQADPLTTTQVEYLGSVDPGAPADPADEDDFINALLNQATGTTELVNLGNPQDPYTVTRSSNACVGCPAADYTLGPASQVNTNVSTDLDVSNWTYLLAKYGNTAYVWHVADLTTVTVTSSLAGEQNGLSHYALFNPGGTVTTPDGGATLGLLGLGLMGLSYLRRRLA